MMPTISRYRPSKEIYVAKNKADLLQGTLDMLILRTLRIGPSHGHAIAKAIEGGSGPDLVLLGTTYEGRDIAVTPDGPADMFFATEDASAQQAAAGAAGEIGQGVEG